MTRLPNSLRAWNGEQFAATLKTEIETLGAQALPLNQAAEQGGYVDTAPITMTLLGADDRGSHIEARVGVFFTELVINCGCDAEPMPLNAYCELRVAIDKASAAASFTILDEGEGQAGNTPVDR